MILVIGATGNTGRLIALGARAAGAPVRALVRNPSKTTDLAAAGVEVVTGDLDDAANLAAAMHGVEKMYIVTSPDLRLAEVQIAAITAAKAAGVRHIVKSSVLGAMADAPVLTARLHHQAEEALKASGIDWTVLQPNSFMQNFIGFAQTIVTQGAIYAPIGHGRVSHVDIRDIADAAVVTLTTPGHEGKRYVITGPDALSYDDAARLIGEATGKGVTFVDVPPDSARQSMLASGMPAWFVDDLVTLMSVVYAQGYGSTVTDDLVRVTGRPARTFAAFAAESATLFAGR